MRYTLLKKNNVTRQAVIQQLTKERYGEDVGLQERQQGGEPVAESL